MNYGALDLRTLTRFASVLGVTAALGFAGCDGDDDDDGGAGTASMTTAPMTGDTGMDDGMDDSTMEETGGEEDPDGSGDEMGVECEASYSHAADIQPLWDAYCTAQCHEVGGEWPSNNLSGDAYEAIVSKQSMQNTLMNYVSPGEPENSYLLHKMLGTQVDAGGSGLTMPKARMMMEVEAVPQGDIDTITCWIQTGAEP